MRFELADAEETHYPIVKISQYTCGAFVAATEEIGVRRSVGRTGVCFNNAQAESFKAALKVHLPDP